MVTGLAGPFENKAVLSYVSSAVLRMESRADSKFFCASFFESCERFGSLALFKDNAMSDSLPPILARQVSCLSTILMPASKLEDTDSRIALDFTAVSVGADSPVTNLSKKGASLRSRTMRPPATTLAKPRDT